MHMNIRFIGEALEWWIHLGAVPIGTYTGIDAALIQTNDCFSIPEFDPKWLVVRARHWDLRTQTLTLYADIAPGDPPGPVRASNALPLRAG